MAKENTALEAIRIVEEQRRSAQAWRDIAVISGIVLVAFALVWFATAPVVVHGNIALAGFGAGMPFAGVNITAESFDASFDAVVPGYVLWGRAA